jgi:peptidyl-prolyl cis-trans isomerase D
MLDFLRQQIKSPIFQAIIIIIVLVFLFWVPQMGSGNNRDSVAVVNGEPISFSSFTRDYNQMVDRLREQFQGNLPSDFVEKFGVKNQVLQRLIRDELLLQGATKMGIHVSNWEIQEQIKHQEYFLTDGVFDKKKYNDLLAQNNLSAKKYEASQRVAILRHKATQALSIFAVLTEWETTTRFQYYLNEIKLNYGILTPELFKDQVDLNEDKISEYFDTHKDNYKTAPEIKLSYLSFSLADAMAKIDIKDEAVKKYYEINKAEYSKPEQRKARHILLETDGSNDAAQKTKAEEILQKLKNGGDFAALAKEFSADPSSRNNGGELGLFSKGQMVPAFEKSVFTLQKNQISDPVKTRFGYHIIQLLEIHPAQVTPLAEVKASIIATIKKDQAKGKAFEEAGTAYEKIFQAGSLATYAQQENISLQETDFFTQDQPAAPFKNRVQLLAKAFQLKKGELSSMIESHDGYYILYVTDRIEPKIPELETVRDAVVQDFTTAEATIIAKNTATAILTVAKEEGLEAALSAKNIEMKTSPWFSRRQSSTSNLPDNITMAGFSLSSANQYPEKVLVHNNKFYVIGFADLKVTQASNKSQAEMFKNALRQEKQTKILNSWLDHLQDTSTIKINKEFMAQ